MKQRNRWLAGLALILILAGGFYYFLRDESPDPNPTVETGAKQKVGLSFSGNTLTEEKDGRKLFELSAETIEMNPDTKDVTLKNLKATFYGEDGKVITLNGLEGFLNGQDRSLLITGNVSAQSSDGATLTAGQIRYAPQTEKFYGEGGIRVQRDGTTLTGEKIESDKEMTQLRVSGQAHIIKKE